MHAVVAAAIVVAAAAAIIAAAPAAASIRVSHRFLVGELGAGQREVPAPPLLEHPPPAALLLLQLTLDHGFAVLEK